MLDSWTWYRVNSHGVDTLAGLAAILAERGLVLFDGVTSEDDLTGPGSPIRQPY